MASGCNGLGDTVYSFARHGSFHVTLYLIVDSASREEVLEAIDFYWCWRRGGAVFTVWPMAEGSLSSRHVP